MPILPISTAHISAAGDTSAMTRATEGVSAGKARVSADGKDPYVEFEAFVLQSFIEVMLPKDAESVFGSGTAGGIWKSMLAEKLGAELAKSGGIGIAQTVAAGKAASGSSKS